MLGVEVVIRNNTVLERENRDLWKMLSQLVGALGRERLDRFSMDTQVVYGRARRFLLAHRVKEPAPPAPPDTSQEGP